MNDFLTGARAGPVHRTGAVAWARGLLERTDWCIVDVETTGLEARAEIVQLGALAPDATVLLDTLVRPTRPIPADATRLHGITDAMVADAPAFADAYARLRAAVGNRRIVAYHAAFDRKMLRAQRAAANAARNGLARLNNPWDCAMERYAAFWGEWNDRYGSFRWQSLDAACAQQRIARAARHTAIDDCRATLRALARTALIRAMARAEP